MSLRSIDFNCDLGEGCGNDAAIMPWISSASIACGAHAGDVQTMRDAVVLCRKHHVAIGAHPSFEDREHFGRRELSLTPHAIAESVTQQIETLADICKQEGVPLHHVKPHGALYNLAARERSVADAIAHAVAAFNPALLLYGLAHSQLTEAGTANGLAVAHEVFAERAYDDNGLLAPRGSQGAVLDTLEASLAQVLQLVREGHVVARNGQPVALRADTLCLHGDRTDAPAFAQALHAALAAEGIHIQPPKAHA